MRFQWWCAAFSGSAFSRLCVAHCLGELFEPDSRIICNLQAQGNLYPWKSRCVTAMACMGTWGCQATEGCHVSRVMHVGHQASWRCRSEQRCHGCHLLPSTRQSMTREARLAERADLGRSMSDIAACVVCSCMYIAGESSAVVVPFIQGHNAHLLKMSRLVLSVCPAADLS